MKVYLAGSIEGLTYEEAFGWRNRAEEILKAHGKKVYNPGKHVSSEMKGQVITRESVEKFSKLSPNFDKELYFQDLEHIKESNIILVSLSKGSTGTIFELGYAKRAGTLIVGFSADPYLLQHPFIKYSVDVVYKKEHEAIYYVARL